MHVEASQVVRGTKAPNTSRKSARRAPETPATAEKSGAWPLVMRTYRAMSPRRQRQLKLLFLCLLIAAFAEMMTIGAVLPFILLIASPEQLERYAAARWVMSAFGFQNAEQLVVPATLLFVCVALMAGLVRTGVQWATSRFAYMLGYDLGIRVYDRFLHQSLAWHTQQNSSSIVSLINKVQILSNTVVLPVLQTLGAALMCVAIIITLLVINLWATLITMGAFGILYLAIAKLVRPKLRRSSLAQKQLHQERIRSAQEAAGGIREVLLDSAQPYFLETFRSLDVEFRRAQALTSFLTNMPRFAVESIGMALVALLAFFLARSEGGLAAALPTLGALALGAQRMMPMVQQIYSAWAAVTSNYHTVEEILDMQDLPVDAGERLRVKPLPFEKHIRLNALSFGYSRQRGPLLNDIDLTIGKGSRIGLIGATGSGKSTLVDIVMGLRAPSQGSISIDDVALDTPPLRRAWQANIAHVPQTIFLADSTIAENVAFGIRREDIDMALVEHAIADAGMAAFVANLPEGMHTQVGERGILLSGGQRQRIGIARALYKRVDLLVFDEATSALDTQTEEIVMEAINGLSRQLTILMIAHRLSTLQQCDQIYELVDGSIRPVTLSAIQHAPLAGQQGI